MSISYKEWHYFFLPGLEIGFAWKDAIYFKVAEHGKEQKQKKHMILMKNPISIPGSSNWTRSKSRVV